MMRILSLRVVYARILAQYGSSVFTPAQMRSNRLCHGHCTLKLYSAQAWFKVREVNPFSSRTARTQSQNFQLTQDHQDIMDLNSKLQGNTLILAPQGRIDHASAGDFSKALEPHLAECKAGGISLVLDFGGIEYISSVGLRALMLAARQVKAQNGRIAIVALTPVVKEVFEISRFNLVFKIFDTIEAATAGVP